MLKSKAALCLCLNVRLQLDLNGKTKQTKFLCLTQFAVLKMESGRMDKTIF